MSVPPPSGPGLRAPPARPEPAPPGRAPAAPLGTLAPRPGHVLRANKAGIAAPLGTLVPRPERMRLHAGNPVAALLGTRASRPHAGRGSHGQRVAAPLGALAPSRPRDHNVTLVAPPLGTPVPRPERMRLHAGSPVAPLLGTLVSHPRHMLRANEAGIAAFLGTRASRPHARTGGPPQRPAARQPDYARNPACKSRSPEARAQAPRKPVIPAQAGIQGRTEVDSRSLPALAGMTGNDGLKETIRPSLVPNREWRCRRAPEAAHERRAMLRRLAGRFTNGAPIDPASPAGGG